MPKKLFKKGQSGNPIGRPRGAKDKRTAYRELLTEHAPELVAKLVQLALDGDPTALRIAIDRIIPALKSTDAPVTGLAIFGTLGEQARQIIAALNGGTLTPDQVSALMGALASQSRIIEVDELERRLTTLEKKEIVK